MSLKQEVEDPPKNNNDKYRTECLTHAEGRYGITDRGLSGRCAIQLCGELEGMIPETRHDHMCSAPNCTNCVHGICAHTTGLNGETENTRFCSFTCKEKVYP